MRFFHLSFVLLLTAFTASAINLSEKSMDQEMLFTNSNPSIAPFMGVRNFVFGSNVLVIDNVRGNDTNAVADPYRRFWKTAFDITKTNGGTGGYGAITSARPGDWIMFQPSATPYYVPQIPLNYLNPASGSGFNLYIPVGAIVIQTNSYNNTNATGKYRITLLTAGPMIIPGNNSRIVIDGTCYATNWLNLTNAQAGWIDSEAVVGCIVTSPGFPFTGVTNYPATNVFITGRGELNGSSDCVYFGAGSAGAYDVTVRGIRANSYSDTFFLSGSSLVATTEMVTAFADNVASNGVSHAVTYSAATFVDHGSMFTATGSTNTAGNVFNGALSTSGGPVFLNNTVLRALGTQNIVPFTNRNSGPIFGTWSEVDTNGITSSYAQSFKFATTIITTNFNAVILSGFGQTGPGLVNTTYFTNTAFPGSFTNVGAAKTVTNANGQWIAVAGSGTQRYFTTNSSPASLFWVITNSSTAPAGISAYVTTTNISILTKGSIFATNWVDGFSYTNTSGASMIVRAAASYTPASVSGNATEELKIDLTQSGTFSALSKVGVNTIVGTLVANGFGNLEGYIPSGAAFVFTNTSAGGGNSATITSGTGQYIFP